MLKPQRGALTPQRTASHPDGTFQLQQNRKRAAMRWRVMLGVIGKVLVQLVETLHLPFSHLLFSRSRVIHRGY